MSNLDVACTAQSAYLSGFTRGGGSVSAAFVSAGHSTLAARVPWPQRSKSQLKLKGKNSPLNKGCFSTSITADTPERHDQSRHGAHRFSTSRSTTEAYHKKIWNASAGTAVGSLNSRGGGRTLMSSAAPHTLSRGEAVGTGALAANEMDRGMEGRQGQFSTPLPQSYGTAKTVESFMAGEGGGEQVGDDDGSAGGVGSERAGSRRQGKRRAGRGGKRPRRAEANGFGVPPRAGDGAAWSLNETLRILGSTGRWREAVAVLHAAQQLADRARVGTGRSEQGHEERFTVVEVDTRAYNVTLAALSRRGRWREALSLLSEMQEKGVAKDTISFSSAISACGRGGHWRRALTLLEQMREEGVQINSIVYCNAIAACGKGKQWKKAVQLLGDMGRVDGLSPNEHCYNSAIDACAKAGEQRTALGLLAMMPKVGLPRDRVSFLSALSACSRVGDWQRALKLLEVMSREGLAPDLKCYTTVISACGNGKEWNQAVKLLRDMQASGIAPNEFCYNAAISACGKSNKWELAMDLVEEMESSEVDVWPDTITYNSAIDACGKSGRWRESLEILHGMQLRAEAPRERGSKFPPAPAPDALTYGTAINACGRSKQWEMALVVLEDMQAKGVAPTEGVFHSAMAGCARSGRWRECMNTLENMRLCGLQPKVIPYNSVITACGRAGQWRLALQVLEHMTLLGVEPDKISYNAALAACEQAGQWQRARQLLEVMRDPSKPMPHTESKENSGEEVDREDSAGLAEAIEVLRGGEGSRAGRGGKASTMTRPRPDGVSFHVVLKALVSACRWQDALEVLEELWEERRKLTSMNTSTEERNSGSVPPRTRLLWTVDMVRFRAVFSSGFRMHREDEEAMRLKARAERLLDKLERAESVVEAREKVDATETTSRRDETYGYARVWPSPANFAWSQAQ